LRMGSSMSIVVRMMRDDRQLRIRCQLALASPFSG
jgi:hypothetical protein